MPKIKTLVLIIFALVFYLFYLNNIVYAGGVDVDVSPLPASLKIDDDVTITARDVDRGITYTGYSRVCWRINELIIEDCVPFSDSEHLTTNLSKQSISDIRPGSYHYEVVLERSSGGYDSTAGVEFTVSDVQNDSNGAGNTTTADATPAPQISIDPIERKFVSESDQKFTIANNSTNPIAIRYSLTGDVDTFGIGSLGITSSTGDITIPAGGTYDLTIVFRPENPNNIVAKNATLKITDTSGGTLTQATIGAQASTGTDGEGTPTGGTSGSNGSNINGTVSGGTAGNVNGSGISLRFPNPLGGGTTTVIDVVRNIINGIFGLLGAVAVAMIVYGGIIYMTGGSSKDGVEKGKKIITSAVVGLVIVLLSLAIIDLMFVLLGGR